MQPVVRARARRRWLGGLAACVAAEYLPSVAVLGQWTSLEAVPGGVCRWRGPGAHRRVALTFDDGPHPEGTPAVLDRLDELGLRATFFLLGSAVEAHPQLAAEVARRGHQVETHGFCHRHHLVRGPRWVHDDLARAGAAMAAVGLRPAWYRPTYGQATTATFVFARRLGWQPVLWSAWGREWDTTEPSAVAGRIRRRLRPGAVVLLHDSDAAGPAGMWRTTRDALDLVAGDLADRHLAAVTLDELVG